MGNKEKAKAYDEVIERTKKLYDNEITEEIFPELKENKDERIKKAIIEFFESEDDNTTYSLVRKKDIIAWLEKQGKEEYALKSFKDEDVRKFMQYIEKQAKAYEFNLPNRSYDIYAFAKDLLVWLENQSEKAPSQTNERTWLYLVSDVLTWKDGIGQYLDDPRVQEFAKRLCSEYAQKLYNPSNIGKNEQKSANKIEPKFKVGDWVIFTTSGNCGNLYQVEKKENYEYTLRNTHGGSFCVSFSNEELIRKWTIQDARDGDVLALSWLEDKNLWEKIIIFKKYHSEGVKGLCSMSCVEGYGNTFKNGKMAFTEEVPYHSKTWTCNLHPATKEQRDLLFQKIKEAGYKWNTETKTLEKLVESKFDPKTLQPFDKVLVRNFSVSIWQCGIFSHQHFHQYFVYNDTYKFCIPYNNDTKHLIGTTDEAPEYYRYWED